MQDDTGKQYDLSRLRATKDNYVILDSQRKVKFILNVCAAVLHGKGRNLHNVIFQDITAPMHHVHNLYYSLY